jgi:hypothetical protein
MQIEYDYYPADNGAIISMPGDRVLDVVQSSRDFQKLAGAKYFGKSIIADIEQAIASADKTTGVLLGVKVIVNYEPIYRKG